MPIIYALVSRGNQVLAEFTSAGLTGNFSIVTRVLLKKIPEGDSKLSYAYDKYNFHYMVSDELTYLCMTDNNFNRLTAFEFLGEIRDRFVATYGNRGKTAIAFAFNADFQRVLSQCMENYSSNNKQDSKIALVKEQINECKNVMIENIDKVLERGERIELLVDRTEVLDQHAFKFKKTSGNLRNAMWWKNCKMKLMIAFILLVILYIILGLACGFGFQKCASSEDSN
mmetsp:Transcript_1988/g.2664  ORF Transcript_1988/g.2664 Transcript_1988/m.2664 type:complete len:227 (-) Transcript_1988:201-881(-)|eukprot:CAMPEP_0175097642 /NCGR_PEP_ID=MMETSP0086_2-20121207/5396_1 /TAXON_ID=136419 /ORGANISM="Unknown Unknown, Strain D1" /LENGTH=226 /DNA_ID=CAMNT_0016371167 /DNA_START=24 /DNA_END=704 /DNA_ORIENTATION=-